MFILTLSTIINIAIFYLFKSYSLITNLIIISSLFLIFYTISDFVNSLRKKIKFDFPRIISHLGFGFLIFFIGINHNFSIEKDFNLKVGQSKVVENFKIDFENLRINETQNYKSLIGHFKITKIDKNQIKFLKPEIRIYSNPETITYEASITTMKAYGDYYKDNEALAFNMFKENLDLVKICTSSKDERLKEDFIIPEPSYVF